MECKYKPTERVGFYLMIIVILFKSCSMSKSIDEVKECLEHQHQLIELHMERSEEDAKLILDK